jgi:hypothetical protein
MAAANGAKKKAAPKDGLEVFRRGCLKGTPFVAPAKVLCKCEKNMDRCKICIQNAGVSHACSQIAVMCAAQSRMP